MDGWIKLHRAVVDSAVFDDAEVLKVWIWLLCNVSYEDHEIIYGGSVVQIKKGQLITGRKKLAQQLKMSESKVYRALNLLEALGNVNIKPNNRFSLITLINWAKYQDDVQKVNSQTTAGQQPDNSQTTAGQHNKRNIESNNIYNNISSARAHAREEDDNTNRYFETFWNAYPKKCGYDKALTAFSKLNPDSELLDTMLKAIAEQKLSRQWQNVQYIPNPATWINGRRWNDKLSMADSARKKTDDKHSYDIDKFEELAVGARGRADIHDKR